MTQIQDHGRLMERRAVTHVAEKAVWLACHAVRNEYVDQYLMIASVRRRRCDWMFAGVVLIGIERLAVEPLDGINEQVFRPRATKDLHHDCLGLVADHDVKASDSGACRTR